jgi:membrane-associated phospholipid phosphatase
VLLLWGIAYHQPVFEPPEIGPEKRNGHNAKGSSRDRVVSVLGVSVFIAGSAYMVARKGLFIHTDTVFVWVIAGLLALSLTDLRHRAPRLVIDWFPVALLFVLYDYSRQLSRWLGMKPRSALQIRFDEFLFGKPLLTLQLQHLLHQSTAVRPWEYALFGVYMTHFFLSLVIAGFLWRFSYSRFREFRTQLVALFTLGFLTYVLYPADPPWFVSQKLHRLPIIYRAVFEVWGKVGLHAAGSLVEHGNELGNQLAAVPSMHAGVSMFICLFFWRGARPWLRAVLALYVAAMAFTLVYSGEHYVFDVVVGWVYATAVYTLVPRLQRVMVAAANAVGSPLAFAGVPADAEPPTVDRSERS